MEEYYNKATKRERDEVMNEENKKQNKEDEFSNTIEDNFLDLENYSFDNNFFIDTFESHQRHDVGRMMQQGEEEKATQQEKKKNKHKHSNNRWRHKKILCILPKQNTRWTF